MDIEQTKLHITAIQHEWEQLALREQEVKDLFIREHKKYKTGDPVWLYIPHSWIPGIVDYALFVTWANGFIVYMVRSLSGQRYPHVLEKDIRPRTNTTPPSSGTGD